MTQYAVSGSVSAEGHLVQYATFRYHSGIPLGTSFRLNDWHHDGGQADRPIRFGLRNTAGTQVTPSLQFNPGESPMTKSWGNTPPGSYALNVRSDAYPSGYANLVNWNGSIFLN